jgi:hypothetical protein
MRVVVDAFTVPMTLMEEDTNNVNTITVRIIMADETVLTLPAATKAVVEDDEDVGRANILLGCVERIVVGRI